MFKLRSYLDILMIQKDKFEYNAHRRKEDHRKLTSPNRRGNKS